MKRNKYLRAAAKAYLKKNKQLEPERWGQPLVEKKNPALTPGEKKNQQERKQRVHVVSLHGPSLAECLLPQSAVIVFAHKQRERVCSSPS